MKIVATRGEIFSQKFTKYRLATGSAQSPRPAGGDKALPQTP